MVWAVILGTPPVVLACAALLGIGLERGAPLPLALAVAIALLLLPTLGLRAIVGPGPGRTALMAVSWSAIALVALPLYFPGERQDATRRGLATLASPLGETASGAVASIGATLTTGLGPDRRPAPPAEPVATPIAQREGDAPPRAAAVAPTELDLAPGPRRTGRPVLIPYHRDRGSLEIGVDVDGPDVGERFTMIFDTGATYTTLSQRALDALEIRVPPDAPRVQLRTANGQIQAPLVLVDAIWLGDAVVEWVTVAVCDSCATESSAGLLGLNVSGQFRVEIDHDRSRIQLRPRRGPDRKLDVAQWLRIEASTTEFWGGDIELTLRARNDALQPVRSAVAQIDCDGAGFAVQVDDVPPGGEAETVVSLPPGTDCRGAKLVLARASWLLDRFE